MKPPKEKREVEEVVEYALTHGVSLSSAANHFSAGNKRKGRNLWRRADNYVKSTPGGEELFMLLLRHGASYDMEIASTLVCDVSEILDVVIDAQIPLIDVCAGLKKERSTYQALYNRVIRQCPEHLVRLRRREMRPRNSETFFTVHQNEFREVRG